MIEPFDIESRARELIEAAPTMGYPFSAGNPVLKPVAERIAIQLARETAEAIANEIVDHALGPTFASEIARRHCRPPEPETREERYRKALEMILKEPALGISQARFAAREALGGGA